MNAKSENTIPTCLSSLPVDPTTMMGRQYKKLCRLHTHLATRAAKTRKACGIVIDELNKLLEEVEVSLTGVETDETFLGSQDGKFEDNETHQDGVFENNETHDEGIDKKVRRLKVKREPMARLAKKAKKCS